MRQPNQNVAMSAKACRIACRAIAAENAQLSPEALGAKLAQECPFKMYGVEKKRWFKAAEREVAGRELKLAIDGGAKLCAVWGCGQIAKGVSGSTDGCAPMCGAHLAVNS